jgi:hypothetical protein
MPHLLSSSDTTKFSDSNTLLKVFGKRLDMPALQQLLVQLAADSKDDQLQQVHAILDGKKAGCSSSCQDLEALPGASGSSDTDVCAAAAAAVAAQLLASLQGSTINDSGSVAVPSMHAQAQQVSRQSLQDTMQCVNVV